MSEPINTPPHKSKVGKQDHQKQYSQSPQPPDAHDPTSKLRERKQPKQHAGTTQEAPQAPRGSQASPNPNNNPQTPAKSQRQKAGHRNSNDQVQGKTPHSTVKKHSRLRNVSQSGDEMGPSAIHTLDGAVEGAGYYSADAAPPFKSHTSTPVRQAYAGPTFHASPAPSTLPIPKAHMSKSMPADTPKSRLQAQVEKDDAREDEQQQGQYSPSQTVRDLPPRSEQESPIDFLLNAHRAQQTSRRGPSPRYERSDSSIEGAHTRPHSSRTPRGLSNKEMFMMEVDGANEEPENDGLAASTSFGQRMSDLQTTPRASPEPDSYEAAEQQRLAKSQALKKLLMTSSEQSMRSSSQPNLPQVQPKSQPPLQSQRDSFDQSRSASERSGDVTFAHGNFSSTQATPQHRYQGGFQAGQSYRGALPSPADQSQRLDSYRQHSERDRSASYGQSGPLPLGFDPTSGRSMYSQPQPPPQAAQPGAASHARDVSSMENSLRRILKLEGSTETPGSGG